MSERHLSDLVIVSLVHSRHKLVAKESVWVEEIFLFALRLLSKHILVVVGNFRFARSPRRHELLDLLQGFLIFDKDLLAQKALDVPG